MSKTLLGLASVLLCSPAVVFGSKVKKKTKSKLAKTQHKSKPAQDKIKKFTVPSQSVPMPTLPAALLDPAVGFAIIRLQLIRNMIIDSILKHIFPDYDEAVDQHNAILKMISEDPEKLKDEEIRKRFTKLHQQLTSMVRTGDVLLGNGLIKFLKEANKDTTRALVLFDVVDESAAIDIQNPEVKQYLEAVKLKLIDMIKRLFNEQVDEANKKHPVAA